MLYFRPLLGPWTRTILVVVKNSIFSGFQMQLLDDYWVWIGTDYCLSAVAIDVTRCQVSVAMGTLDLVRKLTHLEHVDVALLLDDLF